MYQYFLTFSQAYWSHSSKEFFENLFSNDWLFNSFIIFLDKVSEYEYVNTDRLHGSIAGSLLNKKVKLYPNNYYKNKEVFKYSIKNNLKNTKFIN